MLYAVACRKIKSKKPMLRPFHSIRSLPACSSTRGSQARPSRPPSGYSASTPDPPRSAGRCPASQNEHQSQQQVPRREQDGVTYRLALLCACEEVALPPVDCVLEGELARALGVQPQLQRLELHGRGNPDQSTERTPRQQEAKAEKNLPETRHRSKPTR